MPLDATVGGANANSYLTVVEADAYFSTRYKVTAWGQVASSVKEALLIEATRLLDSLVDWKGELYNSSQALRWPRHWALDQDGRVIDSNVIPVGVKNLVCEVALYILTNSGYDASDNPLTSLRLSTITLKFNEKVISGGFPKNVVDLISPWGWYKVSQPGGIGMATLVRT